MRELRLQYEVICAAIPLTSLYFDLYSLDISPKKVVCSFSLEDVRHPPALIKFTTIVRICHQCTPQTGGQVFRSFFEGILIPLWSSFQRGIPYCETCGPVALAEKRKALTLMCVSCPLTSGLYYTQTLWFSV